MLQRIIGEKWLTARAVVGLWPANAVGDDIEGGSVVTCVNAHAQNSSGTNRYLVRRLVNPDPSLEAAFLAALGRAASLADGVRVERAQLGGTPARVAVPASSPASRHVLYLHGGAYIVGGPQTHLGLASHVAKHAQANTGPAARKGKRRM